MEDPSVQASLANNMVTIVLLGKSACDKASIGNSILGHECFSPETSACKMGVHRADGEMYCVINTPDLYHGPRPDSEQVLEELKPSFPDARVFLLVLQEDHVSSEEAAMFARLKVTYGENVVAHTIVVLVGSDGRPRADHTVRRILDECSGRVCSFKHGMKREDLNGQLLRQYEGMQQKCGPERLYETIDRHKELRDKKPDLGNAQSAEKKPVTANPEGEDKVRRKLAEEKSVAAVPEGERNAMTVVLLGQRGSGKSATGNTILGKGHFESRASSTAVTQECKRAEELVCGIKVRVVDTPDFFDEDLKNPELHVQRCKELSQPGPVVYLLVMHMGRFTEGERESVSNVQKAFGGEVLEKTVVLFTGKEKLKGRSLDSYVANADPQLQQLIKASGSRYHAFNNWDRSRHQVKELLKMTVETLFRGGDEFKEHLPGHNKFEQRYCRVL